MSGQFDGNGFSQEAFSGRENAQFRNLFREVSRSWVALSPAELAAIRLVSSVRKTWWAIPIAYGAGIGSKFLGLS